MNYALKLDNVCKTYETSDFLLDNVSFEVPMGSVMGFVGENGAGKTTTIGCILNTLFRNSGSIQIFEKEMKDEDTVLRNDIGVVYDGDNFPKYLTAKQISEIMQGIFSQWDNSLFQKYLKTFRLNEKQKIGKYSKGMTMKLAIAVALSHHPKLLILDEATSGLDPIMRDEMLEVFLDFVGEDDHSILLSSHITSDLEKVADYITYINYGELIYSGEKKKLLEEFYVIRNVREEIPIGIREKLIGVRKTKDGVQALLKKEYIKEISGLGRIEKATLDDIVVFTSKGE